MLPFVWKWQNLKSNSNTGSPWAMQISANALYSIAYSWKTVLGKESECMVEMVGCFKNKLKSEAEIVCSFLISYITDGQSWFLTKIIIDLLEY